MKGRGDHDGRYVTNEHFRGWLNWQTFPLEKRRGVFRIFVLGGSAAFGWPYGDGQGFSGILRSALARGAPGGFEVVNAAGMSFGSHRVLDFLAEILDYDPDLVIVYSGNNEYVERNLMPSSARPGTALTRTRDLLHRSRTYRLLRLALHRAAPARFAVTGADDPTDLRARRVSRGRVERTPQNDASTLAGYRANLAAMRRLLAERSVAGIFCTVPSNLADWPPEKTLPRLSGPAALERWTRATDEALALLRAGRAGEAERAAAAALGEAPRHAFTHFIFAKVLQAQGRPAEALESFRTARDLDPQAIRAPGAFNAAVREIAAPGAGVEVADLERVLQAASPDGLPGIELFLDYVHENPRGHRLVAEALLPMIAARAGRGGRFEVLPADIPPVRHAPARAHELYALGMTLQRNERWEAAAAAYESSLLHERSPEALQNLASLYFSALGRPGRARELFEEAIAADPDNGQVALGHARWLLANRELAEAKRFFRRALEINPALPEAVASLGGIAAAEGDAASAASHFERALAAGYETEVMHRDWGDALAAAGKRDEARGHWERALEINPLDEGARARLDGAGRAAP